MPGDSCAVAVTAGDDFMRVCSKESKYVCLNGSHDRLRFRIKVKDY